MNTLPTPRFGLDRTSPSLDHRPPDAKYPTGSNTAGQAIVDAFAALAAGAWHQPDAVRLTLEASRTDAADDGVRLLLSDDGPSGRERALTTLLRADMLCPAAEQRLPDWSLRAIERLGAQANRLLETLRALQVGERRLQDEVDYRDPAAVIGLFEDRGCEIHDEDAIRRLVEQDPGPIYYGDIDLGDDGHDWAHGGGRWANQLEASAGRLGALTLAPRI
jgi:hypothetical protein